jgi:hypothetical protein
MRRLAPKTGDYWNEAELIEIERLRSACKAVSHWQVDCDRTDAGDPWCVVYDCQRHTTIVHIARIDRRYVVVCPMTDRSEWITTLDAVIDAALREIWRCQITQINEQ